MDNYNNEQIIFREKIYVGCDDFNFNDIAGYDSWCELKMVHNEGDENFLFYVRTIDGKEYALRVFNNHSFDYYHNCYHYQRQIDEFVHKFQKKNVIFSKDEKIEIIYGCCQQNKYVYFLKQWQHKSPYSDILDVLPLAQKLKPAITAAAYLRAAAEIDLYQGQFENKTKRKKDAMNWSNSIDERYQCALKKLKARRISFAAINHFEEFYDINRHYIVKRDIGICYQGFSPRNWFFQPDGNITIPLISHWCKADKWYSLSLILTEIHDLCEDTAVFLIDSYFRFHPPEEFFVCIAIYVMVDLLEKLSIIVDSRSKDFDQVKTAIKSIDQMYAKFTTTAPFWYKRVANSRMNKLVSN